jgi:hypothetical protein
MQIPILSGIVADGEFRTEYPVNLIPVPKATGISDGYLSPAWGIVANSTGQDRGGIEWNGKLYRVLGADLCRIESNGGITLIGTIGGTGRVSMTYGFTYLAVASGGQLWLYDGTTLAQVTDADIGNVLDVVWIDGYYMTTDGEFLIVTELNDPFAVNPLKYGSSEADPDPVKAVLRSRSEVYAVNRYTIEVFDNVGGEGFPFQRITGAQVQKGATGTHAVCVFQDAIAIIGSGKNEAPSVYLCANGQTAKLATREIDEVLRTYTDAELSDAVLETMAENSHQFLIVRLARDTLVYDAAASQVLQVPVWFRLASSLDMAGPWDAGNLVWCYDRWNVGRVTGPELGYLDTTTGAHWGGHVGWRATTPIVYGESRGAVFHELELVGLPGWSAFGVDATVGTQYSTDGLEWSNPRWIGATGRNRRLSWRGQGIMRNWRVQRVFGTSETRLTMARIEARLEPLTY